MQWNILKGAPVGLLFAYGCLSVVGVMKKRTSLDIPIYFGMPFLYWMWCKKSVHMPKLFEISYPSHPTILEARRKAINQCCFFAPSMIRNEIEFMHGKIEGVDPEDEESQLQKGKHPYEKVFETGTLGLSLIKDKKENGNKFKILVQ